MFEKMIAVGDVWTKGSATAVVAGYTKDGEGFVVYYFGDFKDYRVETEYIFKSNFKFCYRDPNRKLTIKERFVDRFNNLLESLYIK